MPSISFTDFDGGIDLTRPSNVQAANRFRVLVNAYVTKGKTIRKRPGAKYVWSWGTGVKGLYAIGGALRGYYGPSNTGVTPTTVTAFNQAQGIFQPGILRRNASALTPDNNILGIQTAFRFGGHSYVVAKTASGYRHYQYTGAGTTDNDIADANCPHSSHAVSLKSKVYAISPTGTVRFSKTDDATNWTLVNDAGFLPVNNQAAGSNQPVAVAEFFRRLVVFYPSQAQLWDVDPDPAKHVFFQRINVGTQRHDGHANVGSDLFFAGTQGVRSLITNQQTSNSLEIDVGSAIDRLFNDFVKSAQVVMGRYFPSLGQYWLIVGRRAMVYSFSKTAKVYAWSEYQFPWDIEGADELDASVYLRSTAGDIYRLDESHLVDDDAALAAQNSGTARNPSDWINSGMPSYGRVNITIQLKTPFLDIKNPSSTKGLNGIEMVATRGQMEALGSYLTAQYNVRFLYRSETGGDGYLTSPMDLLPLPDDTRPGGWLPLGVMTNTFAIELNHSAPEDYELSGVIVHFESLGLS